ncbi:MAG: hypothetical protein ABW110_04875, partial [Steroidobacteraceae bacterium]
MNASTTASQSQSSGSPRLVRGGVTAIAIGLILAVLSGPLYRLGVLPLVPALLSLLAGVVILALAIIVSA